jgi:LysM repeat protein
MARPGPSIRASEPGKVTGHEVTRVARDALSSAGRPLDGALRGFMESRLSRTLEHVRVHTDERAAQSAQSLNARAFAVGPHVVFGSEQYEPGTAAGRWLVAHELTHVVQQRGGGALVQRYEAGEHAQMGETQPELKALFAPTYTVRKGDTLRSIAHKFGVSVAELRNANKDKLRQWPANDDDSSMVEGFNAGMSVSIPQKLSAFGQAALKDPSAKVTVNGVTMDYGVAIAMGDFYQDPAQMAAASPKEITALATLILREQSGGTKVTTVEWETATGGRYLKLAEKNVEHFAPPSAAFVTPSPAGAAASNHKIQWEKYHQEAIDASRAGDKDKALRINAYADHFLTDAFAAGHLVNKTDVMEAFKSQLRLTKKKKFDAPSKAFFDAPSKAFFDAVATAAFSGSVKTEFSKYELTESWEGTGWKPNINSASRFSILLQEIHKSEPDLLANAVAKGLHDKLNTIPGGLPVENKRGDAWSLSGDSSLNADTLKVARQAVAQSQADVISVYQMVGPIDYARLNRGVWDYTPQPTTVGHKTIVDAVTTGTNIASPDLITAVINLIKANYLLIIAELVKRKNLQKA